MNELTLGRRLSDVVAEYRTKIENVETVVQEFEAAGDKLKAGCTVGNTWGNVSIDTGHVDSHKIKDSLLKSAWYHIYKGLNIEFIASADDKKRFEQAMVRPPEFTMENIRSTFGKYIEDPRGNILRGLAEIFCNLDPYYKSHERVKIGVAGLPKRIILSNVTSYGWGRDRMQDVLNALAKIQNKPLTNYQELNDLMKDGNALLASRGIRLKRFANGNGHIFFEPQELRDINQALAEYYGDVLPDADEEVSTKQESRAVSKDLQYYPTPQKVVDDIVDDLYRLDGEKVLEPSCGCGRFLDALKSKGAEVYGIEYDAGRAQQSRNKGHSVLTANFLETVPEAIYDRVVMNPPFYGKHYVKHVKHALNFLKPDGVLTAILPVTARYDHNLLDGNWRDLPVGSFRESGTNINTTVLTIRKKAA